MTAKGVKAYKAKNPGSKLKTAVTGEVKPGSKDAKRRKSFCARSKGWTGERGKAARKRWKCYYQKNTKRKYKKNISNIQNGEEL